MVNIPDTYIPQVDFITNAFGGTTQDLGYWGPEYYKEYVTHMTNAEVTPLDAQGWLDKYFGGSLNNDTNFEGAASVWRKESADEMVNKYNKYAQDIAAVTGGDYIPYDGITDDPNEVYKNLSKVKSRATFETDRAYKQYVSDAKKEGIDPLSRDQWTPGTTIEKPSYKFVMPTEWQTIEDMAKATVQGGAPTLSTDLANEWEAKLDKSFAPVREKLKMNMADYWASLFPQGGGSGKQAAINMSQLSDFETNKVNTALGFAQTDLANKLSEYQRAQQQLQDIGTFKANSDQFKSNADAANYWNTINQNWTQSRYYSDLLNQDKQYKQQADLAKYLAEISKPQSTDAGTTLLNSLVGGTGQAAGMAGMAKLLAMLA